MNNFRPLYTKENLEDYIANTETRFDRINTLLKLNEIKRYLSINSNIDSVKLIDYISNNYILDKIVFITDTSYRNAYIRIDKKCGIVAKNMHKSRNSKQNYEKTKSIINEISYDYEKLFIYFIRKSKE